MKFNLFLLSCSSSSFPNRCQCTQTFAGRVNVPHSMINWFSILSHTHNKDQTASKSIATLLIISDIRVYIVLSSTSILFVLCATSIWFLSGGRSVSWVILLWIFDWMNSHSVQQSRLHAQTTYLTNRTKKIANIFVSCINSIWKMNRKLPHILCAAMKNKSFMSFVCACDFLFAPEKNRRMERRFFL